MKLARLSLVLGIGSLLLWGCSTIASVKVSDQLTSPYITNADNQHADDQTLRNRLQDNLDDAISSNAIRVVVDNNNVLLVGQVSSQSDKDQATVECKKHPAVTKVFNYLTIAAKPSLNINSSITKESVARLARQNDIRGKYVNIITVDHIVYVMGTNVGNLTALQTAIDGIYSIDGVKKVVNLEQPGNFDYTSAPVVD